MAARERTQGQRLFQRESRFIAGAMTPEQLPPPGSVEIAFAGRSNVGKSSLLNALVGRKALARVAQKPGATQQINFFDVAGRLVLVDLPGHGYAKVGRAKVKEWSALIAAYIRGRPNLRRILLLIDSRHGFKEGDLALMELMDGAGLSYQIVMTKADTLKPSELERNRERFAAVIAKRPAAHPTIAVTSAADGAGIEALREELAALAEG
jgi:GTP-binding protein